MEKDIFDLFRDKQHDLDEMPPGHVWQKLEKKLDKDRTKGKVIRFLPVSAAAAVAVIVFMGSLAALIVVRLTREEVTLVSADKTPDEAQMIFADSAIDLSSTEIIADAGTRQPTERAADPSSATQSPPLTESLPVENSAKPDVPSDDTERVETVKGTTEEDRTADAAEDMVLSESARPKPATADDQPVTRAEVLKDAVTTGEAKSKKTTSAPGAPVPAATSKRAEQEVAYSNTAISPEAVISQLEGKWQDTSHGLLNVEEWKKVDAQKWEGNGYTIVDGDTTFLETMTISKVGNQTVLTSQFDAFGGTVTIPIAYYDHHRLVFEDPNARRFPNQVVIEVRDSQLTTTLANSGSVTPSTSQNQYLSKRNIVQPSSVKRTLKKVRKK